MKLSLIIPMYNIEAYLRECLDSVVSQTLEDMEIIIVDDGCTDHSPEIAEEYVRQYPDRVRLLHKPNGGLSDARNFGITYAQGEYIAFLDSDDFAEPDLYRQMVDLMDREKCDVAVTDIEYWYRDPSRRFVMKGLSERGKPDRNKQALMSPMFAWNKVYRAFWFKEKGLRYPVGLWYEDLPVTTLIFAQSAKIGYLDQCLIHYRQREGSIMSSSSERVREIFDILMMVRGSFQENGLLEQYHDEIEWLHIENLRLYGMFRFMRADRFSEYYTKATDILYACFPDWRKNPYIRYAGLKNRIFMRTLNRLNARIYRSIIAKGD
ncbi:MAG: glycosyltransferase [Solobacterium sp.]|nr:glycosyltransferase [Solobacterium sp.]